VLDYARQYLRWAGPCFAFFGVGLTLYFASQGSGKVLGPVLASTLRLIIVGGAGAWLLADSAPAWHYFVLVGITMVIYGLSTSAAIWFTPWGPRRAS
jgi:Na+-driven multidrug efflux pump